MSQRVVPNAESFLGRPHGTLVGMPVGGELRLDARLGGAITAPSIDATVGAPALAIGGLSGVSLDAHAQYSPAAVTLRRLDVAWQDARLQASGRVGLQGRQAVAVDATLERADIAALLSALDRADIPAGGLLSLQANAAGTLSNPHAKLAVQGADLAAYGEILGTLAADAEVVDRDVRLKELRLSKPQPDGDGSLTASGSYHLDRRTFNLQLDSEQLRLLNLTLPDGVPVRGALELQARAQGTLEDPMGSARIVATELLVRGEDLGSLTVDASIARQQADVQVRSDKFRIDADAQIGTVEPYQTDLRVLVDNLDVALLPLELDPPLTGQVRARLNGSGSLSSPANGEATTTIEEMALTWNGQPIVTDGPAVIRYANRELAIDRFVVRAQDSTVAVSGTLPVDPRSGEGAVDLDAQLNLSTLGSYAPEQYGVKAEGRATLTGTVRGSMRAIDPDLVMSVDQGFVIASGAEPGLSNVGIRVEVADGELVLSSLQADWGPAHLDAKARLPFALLPKDLPIELPRQSGAAQLQAAVTKFELQTLPGAPERLAGTVSVQAQASAPGSDLSTLTGQVTFPDLQVLFDQLTLAQDGVSTISIENGEARIERFDLAGSVGQLALSGRADLRGSATDRCESTRQA